MKKISDYLPLHGKQLIEFFSNGLFELYYLDDGEQCQIVIDDGVLDCYSWEFKFFCTGRMGVHGFNFDGQPFELIEHTVAPYGKNETLFKVGGEYIKFKFHIEAQQAINFKLNSVEVVDYEKPLNYII